MNTASKKSVPIHTILIIAITILLLLSHSPSLAEYTKNTIDYQQIISTSITAFEKTFIHPKLRPINYLNLFTQRLRAHPDIKHTTIIQNSITVEFTDGYTLVILDPSLLENSHILSNQCDNQKTNPSANALLLNPFAWVYGTRQCRIIKRILSSNDISTIYVENEKVDLRFIENNLSSEIIYMNTHAGYWEINKSTRNNSVVIATGELWTNTTPSKYHFEYTNNLIVEGVVGKTSYIAFTPALIEQYYNESAFNESFIYMATCHALYDESMASVFLDKDARVYVSWTQDTVFWTNNLASIWTFRLLDLGLPIKNICDLIGSGGFYNWLFDSELAYSGDGEYTFS